MPEEAKTPSVMKHCFVDLGSNPFFLVRTASENSWKSTLLVFPSSGLTARLCSAEVSCSCRSIPGCFPAKEPSFSPALHPTVHVGCFCHVVMVECWMRKSFWRYRSKVWGLLASRLNTTLCAVGALQHLQIGPHSHSTLLWVFSRFSFSNWAPFFLMFHVNLPPFFLLNFEVIPAVLHLK